MFRLFARSLRNHFAAWLCGCWIALTLAVPVVQSLRVDHHAVEVDCVSAAVPTSVPYSDTSVDEASLRLYQAGPRIDFGGPGAIANSLVAKAFELASTSVQHRDHAWHPTLLDLGIALRL